MLAALLGIGLAGCQPSGQDALAGLIIFDEEVRLERHGHHDAAQRRFEVPRGAALVAFVDEDDIDVALSLRTPQDSIAVESKFQGNGVEVAALAVPGGGPVTLALDGAPDWDMPGTVHVRVWRYDRESLADARVAERFAAWRNWALATRDASVANAAERGRDPEFSAAIAHFESAGGDRALAASALLGHAMRRFYYGVDMHGVLRDARRAGEMFAALGRAHDLGRAHWVEAAALIEMSLDKSARDPSSDEALAAGRRLLTALERDPAMSALERARATSNLGFADVMHGERARATERFQQSYAASRAIGNRWHARVSQQNIATVRNQLGEYDAAARMYDAILEHLEDIGEPDLRCGVLLNAARTDVNVGRSERAIARYLAALRIARDHQLDGNVGRALHGLGTVYWNRGDLVQAETYFAHALETRRSQSDTNALVTSLRSSGILARETGDARRALALHREGQDRAADPLMRVRLLGEIALDHAALDDRTAALASARQALAVPVENALHPTRLQARLVLADLLLDDVKPDARERAEAAQLADAALAAAIASRDPTLEADAQRVVARSLAARGDHARARAGYERAIELIFQYRAVSTNPVLQAMTLSFEQTTFREYVDLLMRDAAAHAGNTASAEEERALRLVEFARAANFDALRLARLAQLPAEDAARAEALLARMTQKRVRLAALVENGAGQADQVAAIQLDIANLRAELDRLSVATRREGEPDALAALERAAWREVGPGVTQLSYALGRRAAYVWARDARGIRVFVLPATPRRLEAELARYGAIDRLQSPVTVERSLAPLAALLLPADLVGARGAVEIVADGRVASVPFAALPVRGAGRLVDTHTVAMVPTLLDLPRRAPPEHPNGLAFVALATGKSDGLPFARTRGVFANLRATTSEAQAITEMFAARNPPPRVKLLLGQQGDAVALRSAFEGGVDVLHMATHGFADLRQPLASMLMLSALDPAGGATYLTAGQVQEWRGSANLVYLSACETAVGPARFADGMPGLQRAFLRAGARRVIATLWPIEDVYAREFAMDFYRRLTAGAPPADALSATQRDWQAGVGAKPDELAHRRMTAWAHVLYEN